MKTKPFEDALLHLITTCESKDEIAFMGKLIRLAKITKNHQQISDEWLKKFNKLKKKKHVFSSKVLFDSSTKRVISKLKKEKDMLSI